MQPVCIQSGRQMVDVLRRESLTSDVEIPLVIA